MRNITLLIASVIYASSVLAQVQIQPAVPTVGLLQQDQLWNLVIVNGTTATLDGRLELVLRDRQSGQELMTATTGTIQVAKGALSLNASLLNPIQYNYLGFEPDRGMTGLLPVGSYLACYSFQSEMANKPVSLSEECISFDSEPLSPPLLIFPVDSAELDVSPTQFTWTPPTPAGLLRNLNYEILITEVFAGQKAVEALQQNPSFYTDSQIPVNLVTYSGASPEFERSRWYAWQVIAHDDRNYAGKSDVHVFQIMEKVGENPIVEMTPFVKMKAEMPDKSVAPDGYLKLSYDNEGSDNEATLDIKNVSEMGKDTRARSFKISLKRGENLIKYDLGKMMGKLNEQTVYLATITNSLGEKKYLRFTVKYFNKK